MQAVCIHTNGGPEVLRYEEVDLAKPQNNEVKIRHTFIAVNYSDVNVRRGDFYLQNKTVFPIILGNEASGHITELGPDVTDFKVGDRVAYAGTGAAFYQSTGAYATERVMDSKHLVKVPDGVSDELAAVSLLKGITAYIATHQMGKIKPGQWVLVHAAASGVGMLITQMAKRRGASVIGTVSSAEKEAMAQKMGCDHTVPSDNFIEGVRKIAPTGVNVVFDGIGKTTFVPSFDCAAPFASLINYGNVSGTVPPIELMQLSLKGSLKVARAGFSSVHQMQGGFKATSALIFEMIKDKEIQVVLGKTFKLQDAQYAHLQLERRDNIGSIVMKP